MYNKIVVVSLALCTATISGCSAHQHSASPTVSAQAAPAESTPARPVTPGAHGMPQMPFVVGSAPQEPQPPESVKNGLPDYPAKEEGIAGKTGVQPAPGSDGKVEESVFGPKFWAYLFASIVVKCTPECFR